MRLVQRLLHLEGLAIGLAAIWLFFSETELSWIWLAALFLAPDLAFVAIALGEHAATRAYNLAHSYVGPVGLGVGALATGEALALGLALIWCAHIGVDRFAGYGLKYSLARKSTHLQRVAQPGPASTGDGAPVAAGSGSA
ncbi:MAG: DUF4260 family protein [Chloroflexi bacterium]|nr:DUF4260 family protein [Chloroflexota bacterium]MDA1146983.1 DUF4260 family protein [Chloroflexota bacterium]